MLKIDGKTFMNIQEAVQWLLDNNALPFQSSANYIGNTEIGMGTIVNPSPAKVRIGSLIFFADSKVSTVIGLTENGFICSDQYNDLVDDVVYVSNVALNASGHLIVTLSNGDTIDAGLIKQVNNFSINASQHLIANYNDGTSTDLGAIFSGNISISGNLNVTGGISGSAVTGDSIIENMLGYSYSNANLSSIVTLTYAGIVKNGNKLTFVKTGYIQSASAITSATTINLGNWNIPWSVGEKILRLGDSNMVDVRKIVLYNLNAGVGSLIDAPAYMEKNTDGDFADKLLVNGLSANEKYYFRYEVTFLLSDSLAS